MDTSMRRLNGQIRQYAWGSRTAIPDLLGRPSTGQPQAEYWLGAHASAPSESEGQLLTEVLQSDVEQIGSNSQRHFGAHLPFLMKILAAEQPLSMQVHPTREQAQIGFQREEAAGIPLGAPERIYRDDWPKPEAMVALEPFDGLCGFRDPTHSFELFRALGVVELSELIDPLRAPGGSFGVEETFLSFLRMGNDERWIVDKVVAAATAVRRGERDFLEFCATAVELAEYYPQDPGVLAALLCNRIRIQPGEGVFLRAGLMHAYIQGVGVEIMANSDNVLRGGLTPKHVDIDELAKIVDFHPGEVEIFSAPPSGMELWQYPTPAPEFALWRVSPQRRPVGMPATDRARIIVCTDGSLDLFANGIGLALKRGESAFFGAGEQANIAGRGSGFIGAPGV